jgi:hypothetical protein
MPVARCGLTLKAAGFSGRSPTLDVPSTASLLSLAPRLGPERRGRCAHAQDQAGLAVGSPASLAAASRRLS